MHTPWRRGKEPSMLCRDPQINGRVKIYQNKYRFDILSALEGCDICAGASKLEASVSNPNPSLKWFQYFGTSGLVMNSMGKIGCCPSPSPGDAHGY